MILKPVCRLCAGVLCGAVLGSGLMLPASAQDGELIGTWNCAGMTEDADMGVRMNIRFVQTYSADDTYERTANLTITIAAFNLDMAVSVTDSGTWSRDATTVTEIMSDIEFSSASTAPSPLEQAMLQSIQEESEADIGKEQTMQITSLTAATMEFNDGEDVAMSCERAV